MGRPAGALRKRTDKVLAKRGRHVTLAELRALLAKDAVTDNQGVDVGLLADVIKTLLVNGGLSNALHNSDNLTAHESEPPAQSERGRLLLAPLTEVTAQFDVAVEELLPGIANGEIVALIDRTSAEHYLQAKRATAETTVRPSPVPTEVPIVDAKRQRRNAQAREGMRRIRAERRAPRPDRTPRPDELTSAEAAQLADWNIDYLYQRLALQEPGFDAEKRDGNWFIKRASFEDFLTRHPRRGRSR
jgi:hypothetical protein